VGMVRNVTATRRATACSAVGPGDTKSQK